MDLISVLLLLFAHFVGDFILQSREVAMNKVDSLKHLCIHGIFVSVPILISLVCIALISKTHIIMAVLTTIIYVILHMVQDLYIWYTFREWAKRNSYARGSERFDVVFFNTLGLDQFLHMAVLFNLTFLLTL